MEMLEVFRGDVRVAQTPLNERPVELGRAPYCDMVVDDAGLCDRHWLVMRQRGTVVAYDLAAGARAKPRHLPLDEAVELGTEHTLVRASAEPPAGVERETESLAVGVRQGGALVLVVGRGPSARKLPIGDRPVHIGRAPENDLVLADRAASQRHCRLDPAGGSLVIRDLGSSNGTFVNGLRVERAVLDAGAQLVVGRSEINLLTRPDHDPNARSRIVAEAPGMLAVLGQAERMAPLPWPVLIVGESGSGKEGVATLLHEQGTRRGKPLVTLNAGGVARELVESELFGHERGAFTGAAGARRGAFEQADGGTLFLDEIGELPLSLQARLLRVLETGEVRRVGAESARTVDVRVVCATHRDLRAMVADGSFRQDLFFRLARLVIEVPPLRARPEDLEPLCGHVLHELEAVVGRRWLDPEALRLLGRYDWPGNVRELRNVLTSAAVAAGSNRIGPEELELALCKVSSGYRPISDQVLTTVLSQHSGNLTAAARALGIARSTLRDRLRSYGTKAPRG